MTQHPPRSRPPPAPAGVVHQRLLPLLHDPVEAGDEAGVDRRGDLQPHPPVHGAPAGLPGVHVLRAAVALGPHPLLGPGLAGFRPAEGVVGAVADGDWLVAVGCGGGGAVVAGVFELGASEELDCVLAVLQLRVVLGPYFVVGADERVLVEAFPTGRCRL